MNVKELCKEMLKEKMVSPNTVMLNLQKYKDLFVRVEKGVYEKTLPTSELTDIHAIKRNKLETFLPILLIIDLNQ